MQLTTTQLHWHTGGEKPSEHITVLGVTGNMDFPLRFMCWTGTQWSIRNATTPITAPQAWAYVVQP